MQCRLASSITFWLPAQSELHVELQHESNGSSWATAITFFTCNSFIHSSILNFSDPNPLKCRICGTHLKVHHNHKLINRIMLCGISKKWHLWMRVNSLNVILNSTGSKTHYKKYILNSFNICLFSVPVFFWSISLNFHGTQSILLYEYLNILFIRSKKNKKQKQNLWFKATNEMFCPRFV